MHDLSPNDAVAIQWRVNGIISTNLNSLFQSYAYNASIEVQGIGTENTTLTIPGYPKQNNGTIIECILSGIAYGGAYSDIKSGVLYIQGKPPIILE